jgi:hypothetical protein
MAVPVGKGYHWQCAVGHDRKHYSIFTSGIYKATALDAAFPQEKPHFPEPDCAE